MPDNRNIIAPQDRTKINIHQDYELNYWSREFGVSKDDIIVAVNTVGVSVARVKSYLGIE
ncbi:DUF3606 domain-containing protein [Beggiatoa leptomitoformis]|uniref:DUF3606 domain-containing protein n=1 Tax=Beggiatoa leptomitoformis TaxID=288004 RepID=A0A2N9YCW7_9GAMM|nr:DUF3606 domain-containing protein [Beggiatoa leptomitoformis]ALG66421.1 DUF3606 domain-containing protein [Beggiatoa leptomitoformis]AUI68302.1 DUF3606 domain-containing protein [Beggiatoa leptomitoformis]